MGKNCSFWLLCRILLIGHSLEDWKHDKPQKDQNYKKVQKTQRGEAAEPCYEGKH